MADENTLLTAEEVIETPAAIPTEEQGTDPTGDGNSEEGTPSPEEGGETPVEWSETDIQVPEGFEELDADAVKAFVPDAKEMGLSKENTQKVVDHYAKTLQKTIEAGKQQWDTMQTEWTDATRQDQEIGGVKLEQSLTSARTALNTFGTDALRQIINQNGLGNNVEFIRMLSKIGKAVSEDKFSLNTQTQDAPKTHAQILYPEMN